MEDPQERKTNSKQQQGLIESNRQSVREAISEIIKEAAEANRHGGVRVSAKVHEPTGRWLLQVKESETGKVIREFPPAEYLDVVAELQELDGLMLEARM